MSFKYIENILHNCVVFFLIVVSEKRSVISKFGPSVSSVSEENIFDGISSTLASNEMESEDLVLILYFIVVTRCALT